MNANPLVSIIIPAYRAQTFLSRSVGSLLNQTYPHWEALIISDDSVDYEEILAKEQIQDPRLRFMSTHSTGLGAAKGRNIAVRFARGHIIGCLDSDDAYVPNALEIIIPRVREYGAVIPAAALRDFREHHFLPSLAEHFDEGLLNVEDVFKAHPHSVRQIFFSLEKVFTLWDERFPLWEDILFALTVAERPGLYHLPLPLYEFYLRDGSMCNQHNANRKFFESATHLRTLLDENRFSFTKESTNAFLKQWITEKLKHPELTEDKQRLPFQYDGLLGT